MKKCREPFKLSEGGKKGNNNKNKPEKQIKLELYQCSFGQSQFGQSESYREVKTSCTNFFKYIQRIILNFQIRLLCIN